MSWFGVGLMVWGMALLALAVLGPLTPLGESVNRDARSWESFDASLAARARTPAALVAEAGQRLPRFDEASDQERMRALFDVVSARFSHSSGARHTLGTNWLLTIAGKFAGPLGLIWDPAVYTASAHSLVCSQVSYLLMELARDQGIRARHVGLGGHVVMEAWYENDWHIFDPDTEITPVDATGDIPSVEELALDRELLTSTYSGENAGYVDIIASRWDNTYMSYPEGAHFVWKAEVLAWIERGAQFLKYAIPMLMALVGIILVGRRASRD